jgi:hypothetical protein
MVIVIAPLPPGFRVNGVLFDEGGDHAVQISQNLHSSRSGAQSEQTGTCRRSWVGCLPARDRSPTEPVYIEALLRHLATERLTHK